MYYKNGLVKKTPLDKTSIKIGRDDTNDIKLGDKIISNEHCRIEVSRNSIKVIDLKSYNGTYVNQKAIKEKKLILGRSFQIGDYTFYYKKGEIDGFKINHDLSLPNHVLSHQTVKKRGQEIETEDSKSKYDCLIEMISEKSLSSKDFNEFLINIKSAIPQMITTGSLFFIQDSKTYTIYNHLNLSKQDQDKIFDNLQPGQLFHSNNNPKLTSYIYQSKIRTKKLSMAYVNDKTTYTFSNPLKIFLRQLMSLIEYKLNIIPHIPCLLKLESYLFIGEDFSIIGKNDKLKEIVQLAQKIAKKTNPIVIMGENGTGKELIARMIHQLSGRNRYVAINCAAIPANLLESELFGFEKGAFTGADKQKKGKLEIASGGTLVLDEISEMPPEIQVKLLRVLQEKVITRLGSNQLIPVDLRIISITNQDIYQLLEEKQFREDLFFRLRVHEFNIPPLRKRREDISPLIRYFTNLYIQENNIKPLGFSESASRYLMNYDWPGNIRELENEIARMFEIIESNELISDHHILPSIISSCHKMSRSTTTSQGNDIKMDLQQVERDKIMQLLQKNNGNKMKTAKLINMSYRGFLKKLKRLNID